MSGTVIQKAIIEVQYDDLNKAQLALKGTGTEMASLGQQAAKVRGSTGGLTQSVGDLSVKLDEGLRGSLGRAFKSTDAIKSIMEQASTAGLIVTTVFGGVASAVYAMADAMDVGASDIERAEQGLFEVANAAEVAKAAMADMQASFDEGAALSIEKAFKIAKVRQEIAAKSAQAEIFLKHLVLAESEKVGFFELDVRKRIAQGIATSNQAVFKAAAEARLGQIKALTDDLKREMAPANLFERFSYELGDVLSPAFATVETEVEKTVRRTREKLGPLSGAFAEFASDASIQWQLALLHTEIAIDGMSDKWFTTWGDIKGSLAEGGEAVFDGYAGAIYGVVGAMEEADRAGASFGKMVVGNLGVHIDQVAESMGRAAFSAIAYSESFRDAANDIMEAMAAEASVQALMETARGLAALWWNPGEASAHFAAAAAFGAIGAASIVGTHATGGFNGPTTDEEANSEQEPFTGAARLGPDRAEVASQETIINLNLAVGSRPLTRLESAQIGGELNNLTRAS